MKLVTELKRRNVFRVALFYIVASWVIIQVAETVLPIFEVPDAFLRGIVVVLLIGFLPALVFAWAFELTPDGLKRDHDARADAAASAVGEAAQSRKMNWATLILALVAIGLMVADRMIPEASLSVAQPLVLESAAPASISEPSVSSLTRLQARPPAALPMESSIAVLAFENMSPDPDNAFFAEGISEEILNVLAAIDALRVASRTSSFSLSGRGTPIPEIAAQLGVGHVLEGSVRKAGNQVRITAQLIEAASDTHLWSDTFDAELVDIFAIQEDIAQAIADALIDKLGLGAFSSDTPAIEVTAPTDNLAAYELFLRGRRTFYQRGETLDNAIADLQLAVELDPAFGEAWAVLAGAYQVADGYETEIRPDEARLGAQVAVERALTLLPNDPLALAVAGRLRKYADRDFAGALALSERAASLARQDSTPLLWYALDLFTAGDVIAAEQAARRAWESDPVVGINNGLLAVARSALGHLDEARELGWYAAENGWPHAMPILAREAYANGDLDLALADIDVFIAAWPPIQPAASEFRQWIREHFHGSHHEAAVTQDGEDGRHLDSLARDEAMIYLSIVTGQADLFMEQVEKDIGLFGTTLSWLRDVWQPSQQALRESARFFDMASELGLVALWEVRGYPPGCTRVDGSDGPHLSCPDFPQ